MSTYPECKFYLKGGNCSHLNAPEPGHSRCLGEKGCAVYELSKPVE
ncbi:hypothetical protein LCGC14_0527610 [marine sediment metagenome]|uniref:Uncharacterized protein n=1 Tax=marine sediment metagenome TaxID=412755 RepID=A0A0F9RWV9_9ZZZZ